MVGKVKNIFSPCVLFLRCSGYLNQLNPPTSTLTHYFRPTKISSKQQNPNSFLHFIVIFRFNNVQFNAFTGCIFFLARLCFHFTFFRLYVTTLSGCPGRLFNAVRFQFQGFQSPFVYLIYMQNENDGDRFSCSPAAPQPTFVL